MAHEAGKYDYIVIGGGLAGCVVASLIEAGPKPDGHPLTLAPLACFKAHHSDLDWDYKTVPQNNLDGRECYAAAGKALSGGNAINYGCWTRSPKADYDHWANVIDDQSWSYEGLLPCFKKIEHHYGDPEQDSVQHGFDGPIFTETTISHPERKYPLREYFREAWNTIGMKEIPDGNSGYPLGMSDKVEKWRDGKRQPVSQVYSLTGVEFMTKTLVARITITVTDGMKIATGVELVDGRHLAAKKEVILSAGAYRSPQLLMLSGIGPSAELSRHKIPIIHDLPAVGQNFLDHLALCMWRKLRHPERGPAIGTNQWTNPAMYKGLPSDWIIASHAPNTSIQAALELDQAPSAVRTHLLDPCTPHTETIISYAPAGADHANTPIPIDGTHIASCVLGMAATSRGSISLRSANPEDPPVIDPNYYATATDRVAPRAGIREALALMATPQMREVVECETPPPGFAELGVESSDGEIDKRVGRAGNTFYHAAGSCGMAGVVNTRLRVNGVNGLRVCDASVIPISVAAHLQVPVLALAEKGADIIAEEVRLSQ